MHGWEEKWPIVFTNTLYSTLNHTNNIHLLSIDLEEWFYLYSDNHDFRPEYFWQKKELRAEKIADQLLELLGKSGRSATFFCVGRMARAYPALVRRINEAGHALGAHSDIHMYGNRQSLPQLKEDLCRNLDSIEQLTGIKVLSYRTPAYKVNTLMPAMRELLLSAGIVFDSSMKAGVLTDYGRIPNVPFKLKAAPTLAYFPVSTFSFFGLTFPYASSGYFRIAPKQWVRHRLHQQGYHMLYYHPRDFDAGMKQLPVSGRFRKLKYSWGTRNSLGGLATLLNDFQWESIEAYAKRNAGNDQLEVIG